MISGFRETQLPGQRQVRGEAFPMVLEPVNRDDLTAAVNRDRHVLRALLKARGALLLRNCPVPDAMAFEAVLDATDYREMPYVGGAAPRSAVTGGRVVTANESPPSEKIPFHHEMAQVPNPPGYIFFYCDVAAERGGATSLLDSAEVCETLFELDPVFAGKLAEEGVRYRRVMPATTDPDSAIGRSWGETFQVTSKTDAEAAMREAGMTWHWRENDDLETITRVLPAIRVDADTGRQTFFNSVVAAFTGWNDVRNEGRNAVVTADGETLPEDLLATLVARMEAMAVHMPWAHGDMLWVNNYTVLHSRQPYTGERRVLASIAYRD